MDAQPLVTLEDLTARLEWELDADESRLAEGSLEDLSDDARFYGSSKWLDPASAPRQVKSLIMRAVARHLRNPDGFTVSRAGDETVGWTDKGDDNGVLTFTEREIKVLRQMGGNRSFASVPMSAWKTSTAATEGFVPAGGGDPFPMYSSDTEPW